MPALKDAQKRAPKKSAKGDDDPLNDVPLALRRKQVHRKQQVASKKANGDDDPLNDMPLALRRKHIGAGAKKNRKAKPNEPRSALNVLPLDIWRKIMTQTQNGGMVVNRLTQVVKSEELRRAARNGKAAWRQLFTRLPVYLVSSGTGYHFCLPTDHPNTKQMIAVVYKHPRFVNDRYLSYMSNGSLDTYWLDNYSRTHKAILMSPGELLRYIRQARDDIAKAQNENLCHDPDFVNLYPETTPAASAKLHIVDGIDSAEQDTNLLNRNGDYKRYRFLRKSKVLHIFDRAIEVCMYFLNKQYMGADQDDDIPALLRRIYDPRKPFFTYTSLPDVYIMYKHRRYLAKQDDVSGERFITLSRGEKKFLNTLNRWNWCE